MKSFFKKKLKNSALRSCVLMLSKRLDPALGSGGDSSAVWPPTPIPGPVSPRDPFSHGPFLLWFWVYPLTFFPVCHRGPPKGHALPWEVCYDSETFCLCAGDVFQACKVCYSGRRRPLRARGTGTCSPKPTYLQKSWLNNAALAKAKWYCF